MLSPAQQRPDATNYPHGPPSGRAISLVFAVGGSGGPHAPRSFSSISEDKTGGIVGFYSDKRKESESKQTKRGAPVCADATGRPLLVQRRPCELELVLVLRSWANDDSSESDGAASRNPRHDRGGSGGSAPSSGVSGGTLRFFLNFPAAVTALAETPPLLVLR